jgi:hypothetical protein
MHADDLDTDAAFAGLGYVMIDAGQVQAAVDAYHAGQPAPTPPDFVDTTELEDDVDGLLANPASKPSVRLRAALVTRVGKPYNPLNTGNPLRDAIADGTSHPLSSRFATLAAAQAVFPRATALTEEIDRHAIQYGYDVYSNVHVAKGTGAYICDVRAVDVASVSITSNVLTIVTAAAHGYTATDVAQGNTVQLGGFSTASDATDLTFINSQTGYAVASVPNSTTLTVALTHADMASKTPVAGSHPAVRAQAALYTRAADSGTVYNQAGQSALGVGNQRITRDEGAVLQLRAGTGRYAHSGVVFASGNCRKVTTWATPDYTTVSFCPNLTLELEVDGNRASGNVGWTPLEGVRLIGCTGLRATSLTVYNCTGAGIISYGLFGGSTYTTEQHWEHVVTHDNGLTGFWNSLRTRKATYTFLHTYNNGLSGGSPASKQLHGAFIDHSEAIVGAINSHDNAGHGVWLHNVYGHNDESITCRGNGGHGILVHGFVASRGGSWMVSDNSQGNVGVYDEVYLDSGNTDTYGVTQRSVIESIVVGYDGQTADYPTVSAAYGVYVEDGIGDVHLLAVRHIQAGTLGTYRAPATTVAGAQGGAYLYRETGQTSAGLHVATAQTTVANTVTETILDTVTLPSNTLRGGAALVLAYGGDTDNIATSGTLTFRVYVGGQLIGSFLVNSQATAKTGKAWTVNERVAFYGAGATAAVRGWGEERNEMVGGQTSDFRRVTVDTTAAVEVKLTAQWGTADPGNVVRCDGAIVQQVAA